MQVIGPLLGAFAFAGGLFLPLSLMPPIIQTVAPFTPTYGVAQIARSPLLGGGIDPAWLLNLVLWTVVFAGAAMLLFRHDTKRV